jgi:hypothetical protein
MGKKNKEKKSEMPLPDKKPSFIDKLKFMQKNKKQGDSKS